MASLANVNAIVKTAVRNNVRFPSLRTVYVGGAQTSPDMLRRAQALICDNYWGAYGSTEAGRSAIASPMMLATMPGCVGRSIPGTRIEIVDQNDDPVAAGQEGELRIRSWGGASEYFNDPEATNAAFRGGCFYPGDLGHLDENGLLFLTGRSTERINVGGGKINPAVIDNFLVNLKGVNDAAAFPVEDSVGMVRVWAAVVPSSQFDEQAILSACRAEFGAKGPLRVISLDEIPRNEMGKVMRRELAQKTA